MCPSRRPHPFGLYSPSLDPPLAHLILHFLIVFCYDGLIIPIWFMLCNIYLSLHLGSIEKQVRDIMHKAFWDTFREQLEGDPPTYDHSIILLGEVKEVCAFKYSINDLNPIQQLFWFLSIHKSVRVRMRQVSTNRLVHITLITVVISLALGRLQQYGGCSIEMTSYKHSCIDNHFAWIVLGYNWFWAFHCPLVVCYCELKRDLDLIQKPALWTHLCGTLIPSYLNSPARQEMCAQSSTKNIWLTVDCLSEQ